MVMQIPNSEHGTRSQLEEEKCEIVKRHRFQKESRWMGSNIGSTTSCVTLNKKSNVSMPQCPHL